MAETIFMLAAAVQHLVRGADVASARAYLAVFRERDALMSFLFHSLFRNEREMDLNQVDPLQKTTVKQFRQFIEYYLEHGYEFISPLDVMRGLAPGKKYAQITFDDGYFNNTLALAVLEEFRVPATFFISTDHVQQNKSYWWDALFRERTAQGESPRQIYRKAVSVKSLRTEKIEAELLDTYGKDALRPRSDIDRPLNVSELRDFARNKYVHIGNHTSGHAILTNYSADEVRSQVQRAQDALLEMTGTTPISIAYPNGAHTPEIAKICSEIGLKVGFTVRPEKHSLPLDENSSDVMRLGRFCPHGDMKMLTQCQTYRSDLLLYSKFRDGYLRLVRGQVGQ